MEGALSQAASEEVSKFCDEWNSFRLRAAADMGYKKKIGCEQDMDLKLP